MSVPFALRVDGPPSLVGSNSARPHDSRDTRQRGTRRQIEVQFKGSRPSVTVFTGKPTGGEDRKLVFDARTGLLLSDETYADKPFLYRLHSGEAFGDGGLVVAMMWGLTLLTMTVTGFIIYLKMRRPGATGIRKVFW